MFNYSSLRRKTTSNDTNEAVALETDSRGLVQDDGASHVPATSGTATLLPRPVASLVSFVTQSTSLSLRLGTFFGGAALRGARSTTLTGLELSRAMIEGILTKAGRDVAVRSGGERGKAEAESLLERSVSVILSAIPLSGTRKLIQTVAGYSAYNGHFSVVFRRGNVSPFVDDPIIRCAYVPGSIIYPRCDTWFNGIIESDSGYHNIDPKRV